MIPEHRLVHFINKILEKTQYNFEDVAFLIKRELSIKRNIERVLYYVIKEIIKTKRYLLVTYNMSFLEQDRYLKKLPWKTVDFPEIREDVLDNGITPIKDLRNSWEDIFIYGLDTETLYNSHKDFPDEEVKTDTIQIYNDKHSVFINPEETSQIIGENFLVNLINKYPELFPRKQTILFFSHNLCFDLYSVFQRGAFKIITNNHPHVQMAVSGVQSFVIMKLKGRRFIFMDTGNFYKGSLRNLAKTYFPDKLKLTAPKFLGVRQPQTPSEWKEYEDYSMRDAELHYLMGLKIKDMQINKNLNICYTPASMSSKRFRKEFLSKPIYLPSEEILKFMFKCKHGAINIAFNRGLDTSKRHYCYDVKGLYTGTIQDTIFPFSCTKRKGYRKMRKKDIPNEKIIGFCRVKFKFPMEVYAPCLPIRGDKLYFPYEGESYCTTYDLRLALKLGAIIEFIEGYCWEYTNEDVDHDLKRYIQTITTRKDEIDRQIKALRKLIEESDHVNEVEIMQKINALIDERHGIKLEGNSCYGKFSEINDGKAGAMFHPAFSSLILSHARVKVFEQINIHRPSYTDTDSMIVDHHLPDDIVGDETGLWENETPEGCFPLIIRSKLYVLLNTKDEEYVKLGHHGVRLKNPSIQCDFHDPPLRLYPDDIQNDSFICPLCGADYPLNSDYLKNSFDKSNLSKDSFYYNLMHNFGEQMYYTAKHFVKIKEGEIRGICPNKVISQKMSVDVLEDGKRNYDMTLTTMKQLRTNWISSQPPKRVTTEKPKVITYEETKKLIQMELDYFSPKFEEIERMFGEDVRPTTEFFS